MVEFFSYKESETGAQNQQAPSFGPWAPIIMKWTWWLAQGAV